MIKNIWKTEGYIAAAQVAHLLQIKLGEVEEIAGKPDGQRYNYNRGGGRKPARYWLREKIERMAALKTFK